MWKEMLEESVSKFTNSYMVSVESNSKISEAAKKMIETSNDSAIVFDGKNVVGIMTDKDIMNDVIAKDLDPAKTNVKEATHGPIISIPIESKVHEAIKMMTKNNVRRLLVTENGNPVGIISQKMIVGNIDKYSVALPELESPGKMMCPYCPSLFSEKKVLSKHIDNIHIGKGLLEGNLKQYA
jgi:signal-transduction protein with cAMP-binding, CBS, and nucleotidyltransferase domain